MHAHTHTCTHTHTHMYTQTHAHTHTHTHKPQHISAHAPPPSTHTHTHTYTHTHTHTKGFSVSHLPQVWAQFHAVLPHSLWLERCESRPDCPWCWECSPWLPLVLWPFPPRWTLSGQQSANTNVSNSMSLEMIRVWTSKYFDVLRLKPFWGGWFEDHLLLA